MLRLRDFHKLEWQILSVLQLRVKNKTKGHTDTASIDADTTSKKNVTGFILNSYENYFSIITLFLRVTNAPNTTIKSLRVSLYKSIWNKVSLMYYHDFVNLTIFLFIKKIMNLLLVVVSQIVCHTLYCLKYYKSLVICNDCTNRLNVNLKIHSQDTESGLCLHMHDKNDRTPQNMKKRTNFLKFVWYLSGHSFILQVCSVSDNF